MWGFMMSIYSSFYDCWANGVKILLKIKNFKSPRGWWTYYTEIVVYMSPWKTIAPCLKDVEKKLVGTWNTAFPSHSQDRTKTCLSVVQQSLVLPNQPLSMWILLPCLTCSSDPEVSKTAKFIHTSTSKSRRSS